MKTRTYVFFCALICAIVALSILGTRDRHAGDRPVPQQLASAETSPVPTFRKVPGMTGSVIKNDETNVLGLHWVTFRRDSDGVSMSGFSPRPLPIGAKVGIVEANACYVANCPSAIIGFVLDSSIVLAK